MEQGPDFWCWFDTTQFSYHCVHPIHAKMFSIEMLLHFSQIVQGLHFSAFHYTCNCNTMLCLIIFTLQLASYNFITMLTVSLRVLFLHLAIYSYSNINHHVINLGVILVAIWL